MMEGSLMCLKIHYNKKIPNPKFRCTFVEIINDRLVSERAFGEGENQFGLKIPFLKLNLRKFRAKSI